MNGSIKECEEKKDAKSIEKRIRNMENEGHDE